MSVEKPGCSVILDLLPSYIEGLASSETVGLVEEHISTCPDCRQALEDMRGEVDPSGLIDGEEKHEIDFLRKNRSKNRLVIWVCAAVTALALCAVVYLSVLIFRPSMEIMPSMDSVVIIARNASEEEGTVSFLEIGEDQKMVITSDLRRNGGIILKIYNLDGEEGNRKVVDMTVSGDQEFEYDVPPGSYIIYAKGNDSTTGSIVISAVTA